jgi:hypothetical protein
MYQRLEFGADAKAYIRLQLSKQSTLWQLLCDLPLEMGRVFGFLPPTAKARDLIHFAWHLHDKADLEQDRVDYSYRQKERDLIAAFLETAENGAAIFYGATIGPGGKVPNYDGPVATFYHVLRYPNNYSNEVPTRTEVHYLVKAGVTREELGFALDNAIQRTPFLAALTSLPRGFSSLPGDKQINEELLRDMAFRVETIFVSAYGDDANLIWTRT